MRYAIPVNGILTQIADIPQPWPAGYWTNDADAFLAQMFPGVTGWIHVADDNVSGAVLQGGGLYLNPASPVMPPVEVPRLMSKTQFQDYAISQLGGGMTGMARFTAIMDATRDSADGAVRFAFARYEAADIFEKTNTATLTAIMANDIKAGHITFAERADIIDNWPNV